MRSSTPLMLGIVLGSALIASPPTWADGGGRCSGGKGQATSYQKGHGYGGATGHLLRYLMKNKQEIGLTDEQIAKLRTVTLDSDRDRIRVKADMMVSERELRSLLWDQKAELPAIEAKIREKESLVAAGQIIGIKAKRELLGVLTAEQRTKLKALREQHRQERRHMMRAEAGEPANGLHAGAFTEVFEVEAADVDGEFSAG
ncbi:MAG: Spy/CpxP family protein refolding chaperone [Nitrospira sp.]|nr:Spy/CpxP family protein refolding chaperone [Nitrospira sp.]